MTFLPTASVRSSRPPAPSRAARRSGPSAALFIPTKTRRSTPVASRARQILSRPTRCPSQRNCFSAGTNASTSYCAPCHGALGDGNGITKKLGLMPAVANLQDKRIVEMTDGEIFNTVTHGKNLMGAYGPMVPVEDRWAVIAYLRALQLSQLGAVDDLPPAQRAALPK